MIRLPLSRLIISLLIGILVISLFGLADSSPEKPVNTSTYERLHPDVSQVQGELIPVSNKSSYQLVRYSGGNLSSDIRPYVDHIDFQVSTRLNAWVAVYFKKNPGLAQAGVSEDIRDFIIHRKEWAGNRTADSLASDIYINWMNDNIDGFIRSHQITTSLCMMVFPGFKKKPKNFIHPLYLPRYFQDSKNRTAVIVYSRQDLPPDISRTVDSIRYQPGKKRDTQAFVYFRDDPGFASVRMSRHIADFVMSRKEWAGDRSKNISYYRDLSSLACR